MDMVSKQPIIRLLVCTHSMVSHSMVLSLAQAAVASHGAEAVAGYSVAGEGFVGGRGKESIAWGLSMNPGGIGQILLWRLTNDRSPTPRNFNNGLKGW